MLFETPRLIIRRLDPDDFKPFHEMESCPDVKRYTGSEPGNEVQNRESLEMCIQKYNEPNNDFWVWAVIRKSDSEFVGTVAIVDEDCEIGYRLLKKYWGNGYGKEASIHLVDYAFEKMQVAKMYAIADKRNEASIRILEQSKLERIGEEFNERDSCIDIRYELNRSQWEAISRTNA